MDEVIEFELRRGDEDSAPLSDLQFSVIVPLIEGDELKIKLEFENPGRVSIGSQQDVVIATITNGEFFSQADGAETLNSGTTSILVLPRQLIGDSTEMTLDTTYKNVEGAA